jgi:hypothetical protein
MEIHDKKGERKIKKKKKNSLNPCDVMVYLMKQQEEEGNLETTFS